MSTSSGNVRFIDNRVAGASARGGIHQMRGEEVITPELETSHLTINRLSSCSPTPSNPQRRPITLCWPLSGRPNTHQHTHSHDPLDSASVSKSRNCTKLFFKPPVRPGKWAYVQFVGTIDESHSSAQPQSSHSGHWASHSTHSYFLWSGYCAARYNNRTKPSHSSLKPLHWFSVRPTKRLMRWDLLPCRLL